MIKQDLKTNLWTVQYSKRHPITRKPKTLRRGGLQTKAEAQRVYNELVYLVNKSFEQTASSKMLYKNLLSDYYEILEERGLSRATIDNTRLCLDAHTLDLWGNRKIDSILKPEIIDLIKVKLANRSTSHQKSMLKFIRGAFNHAVDAGYLQKSPVPVLQFRIGNKFKKVLNQGQVAHFLMKADEYEHEWRHIWKGAVYTGMRNEELFPLEWKNVDIENRQIFVRCSWTKKDGFKDKTKNGDDRVVEIAPPLVETLKKLRHENPDSSFVFPRITEWEHGRQAEVLRLFLVGIGLPPVSFHNLRATWATLMLASGVEAIKVMKMGGWKDMKTMNNHYVRMAGVDIKGATDNFILHTEK